LDEILIICVLGLNYSSSDLDLLVLGNYPCEHIYFALEV